MFDLPRLLTSLTLTVAAIGIVPPLSPFALRAIAPPVRSFDITLAERLPDDRLRLAARLDKRWCVFQALGFAYLGPARTVWRVGYENATRPASGDTNRPGGVQTVGPWIVDAPPSPEANRLLITVRHRCGLIDVVTRLAEVEL